jgi:hypothetical protein
MPAGVAGFHGKEPLFGPVREGEHTCPSSSPRRARISCRCMCLELRARSHFSQRALVPRGFADGN